jgi:hypothetical protein
MCKLFIFSACLVFFLCWLEFGLWGLETTFHSFHRVKNRFSLYYARCALCVCKRLLTKTKRIYNKKRGLIIYMNTKTLYTQSETEYTHWHIASNNIIIQVLSLIIICYIFVIIYIFILAEKPKNFIHN